MKSYKQTLSHEIESQFFSPIHIKNLIKKIILFQNFVNTYEKKTISNIDQLTFNLSNKHLICQNSMLFV